MMMPGAMGPDSGPFAVFTFLVAPAIMTNACTLLALGTSNRLARSVDRARMISSVLVSAAANAGAGGGGGVGGVGGVPAIPLPLAREQFLPATRRCRVLIRALRCFYLAVGCFGGGTCIAMVGASMGYFGFAKESNALMIVMLALAVIGVLSLVVGSAALVKESTLTLGLLKAEELALHEATKHAMEKSKAAG